MDLGGVKTDIRYDKWLGEKLGERCVKNLKKNGFDAHFAPAADDARALVMDLLTSCQSFGFGGSSTTRALGLPETLKRLGRVVYDHWAPPENMTDLDVRLKQGRCDCFLCSANAVSATGEIVNVDGVGNRNNAMTFGCPKVVIIAGMNKVTSSLDSALARIREVAAPMRARSLGMETPCAETGRCSDCNAPQRICRITTILHRKPIMTDISVVLINEPLGF
ncbi:lactate utilization protein [Desulfococcus sp.]|uniref:lactate utilization protein n=1 Tax=Desulfococcus sp. TaxID=2025834 RepID=UPI00359472E2